MIDASDSLERSRLDPRASSGATWAASAALGLALIAALLFNSKVLHKGTASGVAPSLQTSIAVLPFLDPTDGLEEEQRSVAEIANALDVAYVLEGSTRRSGARLRVAARLIRADNGVVVWSESYDRPWGDILASRTTSPTKSRQR